MSDAKPKDLCGCVSALISLFINQPIWLVLLFGILSRVDAPMWMWVLYFIYVPFTMLNIFASVLVKFATD